MYRRGILGLLVVALALLTAVAGRASAEPPVANTPSPLEIKFRRTNDSARIDVNEKTGELIVTITSPFGISTAEIRRTSSEWPKKVTLRLRLHGLESFRITAGKWGLHGSVTSHSGFPRRIYLTKEGKPIGAGEQDPPAAEIKVIDAQGKPAKGLPGAGGCFEIIVPRQLLVENPETIKVGWIDFFRN